MSEKTQWDLVRAALLQGPHDDLIRIENPAWPGTPDVNYCLGGEEGFIELKNIDDWPVNATTTVKVAHFTQQQRSWLIRRVDCGGRAWLLLRVATPNDWVLMRGDKAAYLLGHVPRAVLLQRAFYHCGGGLNGPQLYRALRTKDVFNCQK